MKALLLLGLLLTPNLTHAGDVIIERTGDEMTATYTEPSTNEDGSPLLDLLFTHMYHNYGGLEILADSVPASGPTGGGPVTSTFVVPVPDGQEVLVNFWARAEDDALNYSPMSKIVTREIDHLAPAAP